MPTTLNRAYEYPSSSVTPDVPYWLQVLAEDVDTDMQELYAPSWTSLTGVTNWGSTAPYAMPKVARFGAFAVLLPGRMYRTASSFSATAGSSYDIASGIPVDLRPSVSVYASGTGHLNSAAPVLVEYNVTSAGYLWINYGSSGTVSTNADHFLGTPLMFWEV